MERVEVRPKLWRLGAIVVGALGFSAAGAVMIIYSGPFEAKLFGIRLTSYDRYLASMSSTDRGMAERHMRWFLRPIAAVTGLIGGAGLLGYARNVSSLEQSLRWNRTTSGWDLTFSPLMLDRRLPAFVTFVEEYRRGVQDDPELDSSAEA